MDFQTSRLPDFQTSRLPMSRKDQLLTLLKDSPNDGFLLFALAKEHEKAGEAAGAREVYERIVRDHPDDPGTYYHLGKLLERLAEPEAANEVYNTGLKKTKELGETHHYRELMGAKMELGYEED